MTTATTDRATIKREANRRLRATFARYGVCVLRFARTCGFASKTNVSRWLEEDSGECMPLAYVRHVPADARLEILRDEAETLGATVVAMPAATASGADMAACARAHKETSEALQAILVAFADGSASRAEAVEARRQIREAVAELLAADLLFAEAERVGVVTLRKVGT